MRINICEEISKNINAQNPLKEFRHYFYSKLSGSGKVLSVGTRPTS